MSTEAIKMSHVAFDTLKFVERLKAAGLPEAQAKAISDAQRDVFNEALDNSLATKLDIAKLEERMVRLEAKFDGETKLTRWMLGVTLAGVLSLVLKAFF
jgi:DNA-binding transcriptional MerR regulator